VKRSQRYTVWQCGLNGVLPHPVQSTLTFHKCQIDHTKNLNFDTPPNAQQTATARSLKAITVSRHFLFTRCNMEYPLYRHLMYLSSVWYPARHFWRLFLTFRKILMTVLSCNALIFD
jgi:hypothetical protein